MNSGVMIQSFSNARTVIAPNICMARDLIKEKFFYMYKDNLYEVMKRAYCNGREENRKMGKRAFDYMQINKYCIKEIDCYLDYMLSTKADIMNFAYSGMEKYYNVMRLHVSSLEKFL